MLLWEKVPRCIGFQWLVLCNTKTTIRMNSNFQGSELEHPSIENVEDSVRTKTKFTPSAVLP